MAALIRFNPSMTIKNRYGEPCVGFEKGIPLTTGLVAIKALDNIVGKNDAERLLRQFRISTQIQDAADNETTVGLPKDDIDIVIEVVKDLAVNRLSPDGVLIYGRFCEAIDEMKEMSKSVNSAIETHRGIS